MANSSDVAEWSDLVNSVCNNIENIELGLDQAEISVPLSDQVLKSAAAAAPFVGATFCIYFAIKERINHGNNYYHVEDFSVHMASSSRGIMRVRLRPVTLYDMAAS